MAQHHFDALIIGAGFGGIYQLHKLLSLGLSARVIDVAEDVRDMALESLSRCNERYGIVCPQILLGHRGLADVSMASSLCKTAGRTAISPARRTESRTEEAHAVQYRDGQCGLG